jgi:ABC-2 family transporter protein
MIWTTWRQHRPEAFAGLATLVGLAALIFIADQRHDLANGNGATLAQAVLISLGVLPALAGVFLGAPLLARDFEQGTHRLLWTQGTTRPRWLALKLTIVIGAIAVAAALLGAYFAVVVQGQHATLGGRTVDTSDPWTWFDEQGPAVAAYVVFALALGTASGAVLGRTYPAMALTLVGYIAVRVPIAAWVRPSYLPPLRQQLTDFATFQDPGPHTWFQNAVYQDVATGQTLSFEQALGRLGPTGGGALAPHGLTGWVYYQPGDRFWLFQGIEAAIFVALAALLVGLTYYWVTRRVT